MLRDNYIRWSGFEVSAPLVWIIQQLGQSKYTNKHIVILSVLFIEATMLQYFLSFAKVVYLMFCRRPATRLKVYQACKLHRVAKRSIEEWNHIIQSQPAKQWSRKLFSLIPILILTSSNASLPPSSVLINVPQCPMGHFSLFKLSG